MINRLNEGEKRYTPYSLIRDLVEVTTLEGYPLTIEEQNYLLKQLEEESNVISLACIPSHKHDLITAILNEKGIETERSTYHLQLIRKALEAAAISLPQETLSEILNELLEIEAGTYNKFTFPTGLSAEAKNIITEILKTEDIDYVGSARSTTRDAVNDVFTTNTTSSEKNIPTSGVDPALNFWLS